MPIGNESEYRKRLEEVGIKRAENEAKLTKLPILIKTTLSFLSAILPIKIAQVAIPRTVILVTIPVISKLCEIAYI